MTVTYPKKLRGQFTARDMMNLVVLDPAIQNLTLNRYRYSEQRSCKDLTDLIEQLDGQPRELVRDLARHINDEARHAMWLTDLLYDLDAHLGTPLGPSYIDEYEKLLPELAQPDIINVLAAINVTEKRGCNIFAAHLAALKNAPQTPENKEVARVLGQIFPEEAGHVRWGTRWLAQQAKLSPDHARRVEEAKCTYSTVEQAAFEAGLDITVGAELRRLQHLTEITSTLPLWERPGYFLEQLPRILPDLNQARLGTARYFLESDPVSFIQRYIPVLMGSRIPAKAPQPTT
ncbi:ferritin-like domain-containing protein [Candidatus Cyanaurora vandensis]|uniref:ferritin-like domain-containing protein n=1 Tax=Candidatus Cyanaurora vandensis TaxID=2714958 RepID=UPI0025801739|nr:ferritin-like domain-containing protein [Candidatus Cyanaurora vandensis]